MIISDGGLREKELLENIKNVLSEHLGTYTFSGGQTAPAIWLRPPQPPTNIKVTGLECILFRNNICEVGHPINGGYQVTVQHTIFLVQHDLGKPMTEAMALMALDPYYTMWANPVELEQEPSYVYGRFYLQERWKTIKA